MVSLFSNITLWNSAWVLLDLNTVDNTVGRSIVYIALGTWLLYASDAVYGAFGVYPARTSHPTQRRNGPTPLGTDAVLCVQ